MLALHSLLLCQTSWHGCCNTLTRICFLKRRWMVLVSLPCFCFDSARLSSKLRGADDAAEEGEDAFDHSKAAWNETLGRLDRPGIRVSVATYAALLRRCGDAKLVLEGKRLYALIVNSRRGRNRYLGNLVVEMYGNRGAFEDA
eukprot:c45901_g1_i1 orf=24-452(+)